MTVITRFAPSPTGYLHIGSARTALFNYLFARRNNGKFLLRIEDTDRERSTTQAVDALMRGLIWLGLKWDGEGVFQSQRNDRHKEAALELLQKGQAYYCFTPQSEIEILRNHAFSKGEHFIFKSPWRDADPASYPKDQKPVIRLKAPRSGQTIIRDTLQGNVVVENDHLDDMVLLRSDGTATYMLAVVVDDHDMAITHIIRGDDHLTNAARQILLYNAFGWEVPVMTHIPLIHGADGAKLSKRHGALGVEWYKEAGYLPEALCNYLLRLGWAHGDDEFISMEQAIEWFNLEGLGKSPARLDFAKMNHLNAHYLRNKDDDSLLQLIIEELSLSDVTVSQAEAECIKRGIETLKPRAELVTDLARLAKIYLVNHDLTCDEEAKVAIAKADHALVNQVRELVEAIEPFEKGVIQDAFKKLAVENNLKLGELMGQVRPLVTGMVNSPSVFEVMEIIGKAQTLKRCIIL